MTKFKINRETGVNRAQFVKKGKQVVKVIWHKAASPPHTDSSIVFARWSQCAIPRRHIGATWQIRLNLSFLRPTRVHNPNVKSLSSATFTQLTAECHRENWCHLTNTSELVHMGATWRIRMNFCFLWPILVHNPNGKSIGSAVFTQLTAESSYTSQWEPLSAKIAPSHGKIWTPSNTWFLGPIRVHNPNGMSISSAVFAQTTTECP